MAFYNQVKLDEFDFKDYQLTVSLAAGITADDIGKAVTQDASAANTVKLAGDGDPIDGILRVVESRAIEGTLVGTVEFHFAHLLPIKTGLAGDEVVAVGSRVVGAGNGEIKAIANTDPLWGAAPKVWEIRGTNAVVLRF